LPTTWAPANNIQLHQYKLHKLLACLLELVTAMLFLPLYISTCHTGPVLHCCDSKTRWPSYIVSCMHTYLYHSVMTRSDRSLPASDHSSLCVVYRTVDTVSPDAAAAAAAVLLTYHVCSRALRFIQSVYHRPTTVLDRHALTYCR